MKKTGYGQFQAELKDSQKKRYKMRFTPLEKATDSNRWSLPIEGDGNLKPPPAQVVRERSSLTGFTKALIVFLVIGLVLLFRHNIIQIKVITTTAKTTFVGKGVFIQTYGRCKLRVKVAFNLPKCRFISKTGKGYLVKIPALKAGLEIVAFRAKTTIVGKNIFVQSLKRCRPRFKLSVL